MVLVTESLKVLVPILLMLHKDVRLTGLNVSWAKTKVQPFGGLLEESSFFSLCAEDTEVTKNSASLGSVVHNNDVSHL